MPSTKDEYERPKDAPKLDPKRAEQFVANFDELVIEEEQPKPPVKGENKGA